jgi:hypothetical protein
MSSFVWVVEDGRRFEEIGCPHCGEISSVYGRTPITGLDSQTYAYYQLRFNPHKDQLELDPRVPINSTLRHELVGVVGTIEKLKCIKCNWSEEVTADINYQGIDYDVIHDKYWHVTNPRVIDTNQMSIYDVL